MDQRREELAQWTAEQLHRMGVTESASPMPLEVVSGDASFRRYFRARINEASWVAVDAPPNKEDSHPFVAIARSWFEQGVRVPEVYQANFEQGFMLLSDLGDTLYLPELNEASADKLYQRAFSELIKIQQCKQVAGYALPPYDREKLHAEMQLCPEWFFNQLLGLHLSASEQRMFDQVRDTLIQNAMRQTQVNVHRDYHSRNLMLIDAKAPGVIDFQDAVIGPITYDLVSLLRDCYISWPEERIHTWVEQFAAKAMNEGLIDEKERTEFRKAFDLMGMQRHIKCVGIFSRLNIRDGKSGYLKDIPLTFAYIQQVCREYDELAEFGQWLEEKVVPAMIASTFFKGISLDPTGRNS